MTDIRAITVSNADLWTDATILPARLAEVNKVATRLCAIDAKGAYQEIAKVASVPWFAIAVIHEREASQNWSSNIAQGDPWNQISRHVPRGRGPFKNFHDAAVDALTNCAPFASKWKDWSAGGTLTLLELYNGTGYEDYHHESSPYLWGATNHEEWGKYVADGHWSAAVWDTQIGTAAMLKAMMALDQTIQFAGATS